MCVSALMREGIVQLLLPRILCPPCRLSGTLTVCVCVCVSEVVLYLPKRDKILECTLQQIWDVFSGKVAVVSLETC